MAPILHCIRHGQGYHNLGAEFHTLLDPKLTPLGEEQCIALRQKHFPDQSKISLITASPLLRTLHTAYLTLEPALKYGKARRQILAIPDAQETSAAPCDTGSDVEVLRKKCEDHHWPVDLSLVHEGWNVKAAGTRYSSSSRAIDTRARDARLLIREKMRELVNAGDIDAQVVLVSHGTYLHYFTEDWEDSTKNLGTGWDNCETRAYTFEDGIASNDPSAHLIETMESRRSRGLEYPVFSHEEQERLFHSSVKYWIEHGQEAVDDMDNNGTAAGQSQALKGKSNKASVEVEVVA